jgi:hypothetical protein
MCIVRVFNLLQCTSLVSLSIVVFIAYILLRNMNRGTHDGKYNMSTYVLLSFIYSIKSRFLVNLGVAVVEVSVRSRVTVVEEEACVEAAVEDSGSSDIDDGRGERRSKEQQSREQRRKTDGNLEFWDERKMTWGRLIFIGSKIS